MDTRGGLYMLTTGRAFPVRRILPWLAIPLLIAALLLLPTLRRQAIARRELTGARGLAHAQLRDSILQQYADRKAGHPAGVPVTLPFLDPQLSSAEQLCAIALLLKYCRLRDGQDAEYSLTIEVLEDAPGGGAHRSVSFPSPELESYLERLGLRIGFVSCPVGVEDFPVNLRISSMARLEDGRIDIRYEKEDSGRLHVTLSLDEDGTMRISEAR